MTHQGRGYMICNIVMANNKYEIGIATKTNQSNGNFRSS